MPIHHVNGTDSSDGFTVFINLCYITFSSVLAIGRGFLIVQSETNTHQVYKQSLSLSCHAVAVSAIVLLVH